uniref:Putative secreted protein n=1 Tax=Anopheles marajoara TaxID=58244 RepID=A0A2M4CAQ6_9DIPT
MVLQIFMLCSPSTRLIAIPLLPKRPVRPMRCRYVSQSARPFWSIGRSKFTTIVTCATSMPLESTLVVMSTFSSPARKRSSTASR